MTQEKYCLKLIGLADGEPTLYDGQFLKAYDPTWNFAAKPDELLIKQLETTAEISEALVFDDIVAATECWRTVSPNMPRRLDGRPNRPLTAFSVEFFLIPVN